MKWIKLLITVSIILLYSSTCLAENDENRWKWSNSSAEYGYYIDTKTIDRAGNIIKFWSKRVALDGSYFLSYDILNLTDKTMHNEGKTYNYDVNNNLINSSDFSGESIHRDILPDTRDNWLADTVCEFLNIKKVNAPSNWQWLYSTNKYTYCVDINNIFYNIKNSFRNNNVKLFIRRTQSDRAPDIVEYGYDLKNTSSLMRYQAGYYADHVGIFPDSIEEVIYHYAKNAYKKYMEVNK